MPRAPRSAVMAARSPRCAPTTSPRFRSRRWSPAMPRPTGRGSTKCFFGCANQAGEDNRNVARMALLLGRAAGLDPRRHRQPAVRFGPQCGRRRGARDPRRRDGFRHRRRRRIDDAGAVRHGQGRRGVFALGGNLRHHARLALHQSAAQGAIRRRFDGRDRRERRRGIPGHAQGSGRFRAALAAARRQGHRHRLFRQGDRSGRRRRAARPGRSSSTRTSIRAPTPRSRTLQKLKPIVRNPGTVTAGNASGINDGAAAIILASEEAAKAHGLTPRARVLGMASAGVPPRIMGIGPVPSTRKLMERLGLEDHRFRSDRDQRGVRRRKASPVCASSALPTTPSTSIRTAAPSRSAIRSACRARG